ncbi:iron-containing alcohol dehydrogenase [Parahaliea mediterranea]|uniref:Iron-containing alcohol dehydrogenase n=1 Tax=Parahaliea mediterranea TaxID=651086 RepID=A0A939IIV0_9GAMM|nr:iron-containing alcohol dehydrogenase [Parahaliea mediterranea]MBN7796979.1 iron-containing alcohol dehydrogenase [Parahaliea mediterranea]
MRLFHWLVHKLTVGLLGIVQKFLSVPTQMLFAGEGSSRQLARHMVAMGHRRILLVTDQVLIDLGMADNIRAAVEGAGGELFVYAGVLPDPTTAIVEEGLAQFRAQACDSVLALGGGSSIDAAKGIAASETNGPVESLVGILKIRKALAPLFAIPTTSGTGSEATFAAVISDAQTHRKGFLADMKLVPLGVSLDPALLTGMPRGVTAATGADALTHAIETYIGRWSDDEVRRLSGTATRLLFEHLPRAYHDGQDMEAREAVSVASYYAGQAINHASVGMVHAIAHQFGGLYGTPHGIANAIVLPNVLDCYLEHSPSALAELADIIGVGKPGQSDTERAKAFVQATRDLLSELGLATRLDAFAQADIPTVANDSMAECRQYPVPHWVSRDELESILHKIAV